MAQRGKALLCSRAWQTTACGSKLALRLSIYSLNYDLDVKCPHTHSSSWSLIPQPAAASRGCATFRGWNLIRGGMLLGCGSGGLQPSQFLTWLFLFLLLVLLFFLPLLFLPRPIPHLPLWDTDQTKGFRHVRGTLNAWASILPQDGYFFFISILNCSTLQLLESWIKSNNSF